MIYETCQNISTQLFNKIHAKGSKGVYGLKRAFKMAGVDFLIISLWEIPDKQTQEFMSNFYKQWLIGYEIRDAFSISQNNMKEKYKNIKGSSYAWAAFVLIE